jgi:hypothetical protein
MGALKEMPQIELDQELLKQWGDTWLGTTQSEPKAKKGRANTADAKSQRPKAAKSFDKKQGMDFGFVFDSAFGKALSVMRIPTKPAMHSNLKPATRSDLKPAIVPI